MKTSHRLRIAALTLLGLLSITLSFAQLPQSLPTNVPGVSPKTEIMSDSTGASFDQAIAAQAKGDKAATVQALETSTATLESEAKKSKGSFKDKLASQAGNLKKLIPLAQSGLLKGDVLSKAMGLAKLAFGGSKLESLLSGASLLGKASALTGNLNLLQSGLSALGGSAQSSGGSMLSSALSSVSKLDSGGATAEPAVRSQLGGVLNFVKGAL